MSEDDLLLIRRVKTPYQTHGLVLAGNTPEGEAAKLLIANATTAQTLQGPLRTAASTPIAAGFNIASGVIPNAPREGDFWLTGGNLKAQLGGRSLRLLTTDDLEGLPEGGGGEGGTTSVIEDPMYWMG